MSISSIQKELSLRLKERRLQLNFSQLTLSERSGVSYSSIRRFEKTGEISLKSLLMIASTLGKLKDFECLFEANQFQTLKELKQSSTKVKRKRGSN